MGPGAAVTHQRPRTWGGSGEVTSTCFRPPGQSLEPVRPPDSPQLRRRPCLSPLLSAGARLHSAVAARACNFLPSERLPFCERDTPCGKSPPSSSLIFAGFAARSHALSLRSPLPSGRAACSLQSPSVRRPPPMHSERLPFWTRDAPSAFLSSWGCELQDADQTSQELPTAFRNLPSPLGRAVDAHILSG
ncbi:hypothetical protein NDU88_001430 [Pleurodeles waltl]|uniref:Uncharacterized protein n=1 Tax=Pleurodeles waltl TaxID=8319 RepID=A0AAV7R766_PLEWA|nr:hypothetical protein NDU88_001430 [Pleurodeles waltl]